MTESNDIPHRGDTRLAVAQMEKHLVDIKQRQSAVNSTVNLLSKLSEQRYLDPTQDYKLLTRRAAESVLNVAGRRNITEGGNLVLDDNHRSWSAVHGIHWAHQLHQEFDLLEQGGSLCYGNGTVRSEGSAEEGDHYDDVIKLFDETHEQMSTKQADEVNLEQFVQVRGYADALRSQVKSEKVLPELVNKIYKDLSEAHSSKLTVAPSARKRPAVKWDKALSIIEGAVSRFDSHPGWVLKEGQTFEALEDRVEKLHTVTSGSLEKKAELESCKTIFNNPDPWLATEYYDQSRLGDLGALLDHRSRRVQRALLYNNTLDHSDAAAMDDEDLPGALDEYQEAVETTLQKDENVKLKQISNFGIPEYALLSEYHQNELFRALSTMVDEFVYVPETTHFRPSIALSHMGNLVQLCDQTNAKLDQYLLSMSEGNLEEDAPREELLEAFEEKCNSMTGSADAQKASEDMRGDYQKMKKVEIDREVLAKDLVRKLHSSVRSALVDYEGIHQESNTRESLVNLYRTLSDVSAADAFWKENYEFPASPATNKKERSQRQSELQAEIKNAKINLDLAWKASRASEAELEEMLAQVAVRKATLESNTEVEEDTQENVSEEIDPKAASGWLAEQASKISLEATQDVVVEDAPQEQQEQGQEGAEEVEEVEEVQEVETEAPVIATAVPWKSSFDWSAAADEDEDEDPDWWNKDAAEFLEKYKLLRGDTSLIPGSDQGKAAPSMTNPSSSDNITASRSSSMWLSPGGMPASRRRFNSSRGAGSSSLNWRAR
ncbi:hypothetical protein IAR50_003889 [Cryptococcus sp. DSM 104548]